ncbi:vacuolar protein 14 C-terminal Fig4p binding-domain-containing protein [Gymnopilus junonius]|uniref:Vacuolar protein 14 C-terminal Fig4p binding-domain-containing protein n=1 Tax=Gymnopilus junonius TaxID=109634 RepID=A0A9P5TUI6_GYMJU|nr:vacuolar protein 14 C-terminal Fig4p binding-domain-containing protein [Gymnopilus junonius]
MDSGISKQLIDKIYEKRKAAALELEKQIRECHQQGEQRRISQIIDQLVDMFSNSSNPLHIRNGGLIGLAGTAIALGVDVAPFMEKFVGPLLDCFVDPENRIRYFSAECLYNIAKVSKGEVLVYFNDIFDALSKLAADSELSVKNGAELLDRLLKDIVAESASVYIPLYPETERVRDEREESQGVLVPLPDSPTGEGAKKAFSLAHFIPLLRERIYVVSPFTRSYLVSWITVLDSVPELELITYLPEFLDGLLKYLSDPTEDVRIATENLLADFLRELRDVTYVSRRLQQRSRAKPMAESVRRGDIDGEKLPDLTMENAERALYMLDNDEQDHSSHGSQAGGEEIYDVDDRDAGAWMPGQGVKVDYAAIIEILIQQLDGEHDEIQQSTALRWLAEFLNFAPEVMIPFTPRLIPAILPNLAHHVSMIQSAAIRTNKLLLNVIQKLPSPPDPSITKQVNERAVPQTRIPQSPTPTTSTTNSRQSTISSQASRDASSLDSSTDSNQVNQTPSGPRTRTSNADLSLTPRPAPSTEIAPAASSSSRPHSPASVSSQSGANGNLANSIPPEDGDPFDYQATVNELTIQFLSEFEETRVAALKWLIMLHQKAPKKILAMDDGTFPALLKTLSDSSEEVIKHDLQLLAQISSSSEETYFKAFMMNLLELFSTDRRLLETRGSLIIRQLCLNLNTEKIYRTFAEIIEKEDDLEFASVIIQKLNLILITSPELADFRKRLKGLETKQDGQTLFTTLYRSWCHNAVSVFSLCLLAQAYEHASNLLHIFADLEITVPMLVQVDKLVQLIESPVFTYIRLQLLEPEKYPYLFKCLYGLLMLLPQSSAFVSLRNRLNAVNAAGYLQIAPKTTVGPLASRSKLGRDEIKWQELLLHFRTVQAKHEKARRQALGNDTSPIITFPEDKLGEPPERAGKGTRPPMRRRVTGEVGTPNIGPVPPRGGALSPLNPKARVPSGLTSLMGAGSTIPGSSNMTSNAALAHVQKQRRPLELNRK